MTASIIVGTGSYTPEKIVTNDAMSKIVDTSDEWIKARTGIRERRFAAEGETTSDMALKAAQRAVANAGIDLKHIDCILVATMTPDMPFPRLPVCSNTKWLRHITAFDIQAACSGFIYALNLANTMILSQQYKSILVVGAEKLSSILDFEDRTTCVLFMMVPVPPSFNKVLSRDGASCIPTPVPTGTPNLPASPLVALPSLRQQIRCKIAALLQMNGRFSKSRSSHGPILPTVTRSLSIMQESIDLVIPHQANMRIIESLAKRLDIPMEKFHNNLDLYGNTSAASIGIALDEAIAAGRINKGDHILLVAFGAGLTWGSQVIRW